MRDVRALAGVACVAPLVALASCGLELAGTGGEADPDSLDPPPTARIDAAVTEADTEIGADADVPFRRADAGARDASIAPQGEAATTCSFAGTFAMKLEFDVEWQGAGIGLSLRPLIAPGSGTLVVYTAASVRAQGDELIATLAPCGTEIPDFRSSGGVFTQQELYGVHVSDMAWDSMSMPRWDIRWRPECVEAGCVMHSSPFAGWIGAEDAPHDVARGSLRPIDVDGDGNAGITLLTRRASEHNASGEPYTQPPIELVNPFRSTSRAHEVMLAIAMGMRFEGTVRSCDRIEGTGRDGHLRVTAFGCTATEGSSLSSCPPTLARVVDATLPSWEVRGARYRTERIADARCESVRASFRGR